MLSLKAMAMKAKNKKNAVPLNQKAKNTPSAFNLSTEFVHESDEDKDENSADGSSSNDGPSPADAAPVSSKANGQVITATGTSSIGSGSGSEADEGEEEEQESTSEGSEDSEVEEESLPGANMIKPVTAAARQFQNQATAPIEAPKKPPPYAAPASFEVKSIDTESNSSKLFKKSNLEGKQIWYITAPASVSIASIEQISLEDIKKGKMILSHNDNDYGFMQDSTEDKTYTKILAPSSSDEGYRAVAKPMDQILHLQRIIRLPGMKGDDDGPSRTRVPAQKLIRPQPAVLKMRFRPIGFGEGKTGNIGSDSSSSDGTSSDSDEEMQDAPTSKHELVSPSADSSITSSEASDEEPSSRSDVVMTDAPLQPLKKSSKSVETPTASATLKRKHSDFAKSKAKNSSSQSTTTTDHKQLKRIKTKQIESQKSMVKTQSVSTERQNTASILPLQHISTTFNPMPPPSTPKPKPIAAILPSSASRSTSQTAPILPLEASSTSRSTVKSTPIPPSRQILPPRSSETAGVTSSLTKSGNDIPSRDSKTTLFLEEQIAAIDSNLSAEQRSKEIKRLKRNLSSRISKGKRRSWTEAPVESKVDGKITPIPPPPQRSGTSFTSSVTTSSLPQAELSSVSKSGSQESMETKGREERKQKKREKKRPSENKAD